MPATVWKGYLSFGLVSFPVRLFSAARPETIHFHMLHNKDLSRIKEVWYCAEENKPVDRSDIVKGYETGKGEYVVVEEEELKKIAPPTATTMEILQFVAGDDVDPIFFESSYYVAPEEAVSKPYALFMAALSDTKHNAIAKMAMHNREHIVLIRPAEGGLLLHTLYYPDELHKANKAQAPKSKYSAQELQMAKTLVEHLTGPFEPSKFHDTYRENVERLIEQKQKGQKITTVKQPRNAPVIDIMEALKRSLKAAPEQKPSRTSPRKKHKAA
ncbi:MAG: Ku protein [Bryobacterales bacterium]|nr:Ku protein [Bryobacterales bacterium]MBV9397137.1 Ku protein [Bryobacterales bacterium]